MGFSAKATGHMALKVVDYARKLFLVLANQLMSCFFGAYNVCSPVPRVILLAMMKKVSGKKIQSKI